MMMTTTMTDTLPVSVMVVGCDHAGYSLKEALITQLQQHPSTQGITLIDVGCNSATDAVDYPNISQLVAQAIQTQCATVNPAQVRGLITCGSGVGVAIAANRFSWVRAVHAHEAYLAQLSRQHNNTNVLCMGGRFVAPALGWHIVQTWLAEPFEGERHARRVNQLAQL
jgi:ribose 5-phosphate isomerase B